MDRRWVGPSPTDESAQQKSERESDVGWLPAQDNDSVIYLPSLLSPAICAFCNVIFSKRSISRHDYWRCCREYPRISKGAEAIDGGILDERHPHRFVRIAADKGLAFTTIGRNCIRAAKRRPFLVYSVLEAVCR